jgi:Fuc2NAc and GlcNAc transferase
MYSVETFSISFIASLLLVYCVRMGAIRIGLFDIPNARSSHLAATPRGGGIVIAVFVLIEILVVGAEQLLPAMVVIGWTVGGMMIAAIGLIDDLRGVSAGLRLAVQAIGAVMLVAAIGGMQPLPTPWGVVSMGHVGWVVGVAAILWCVNLYNFMDGIDGLAGAQSVFVATAGAEMVSAAHAGVRLPLLVLSGSSLGFLVWNLSPRKIFLGDVGSGFIGFSIAGAAFVGSTNKEFSLWAWLALNGLFFVDATTTLIVRTIRGERPVDAHRSHVYQRLAQRLNSHRAVTAIYTAVNVLWCLPWALASRHYKEYGLFMVVAEIAPLFLVATLLGAGRMEDKVEPEAR